MTVLMVLAAITLAFCVGVCLGSMLVEDLGGELRLPPGWWVLPGAIMGGLLMAAVLVGVGV